MNSLDLGTKRSRSPNTAHPSATSTEDPRDAAPTVLASLASPQAFEQLHVHAVYDIIAPHFSSTRYKPWPRVKSFVEACVAANSSREEVHVAEVPAPEDQSLRPTSSALLCTSGTSSAATRTNEKAPSPYGALIIDVGCGNGKNMCVHDLSLAYAVGCDRSLELMKASHLGAQRTRKVELVKEETKEVEIEKPACGTEMETAEKRDGAAEDACTGKGKKGKGKENKMVVKVSTEVSVPPALQRGLEFAGSDALLTPYRSAIFDVVISIAVVHHFSTVERRREAIRELLRLCVVGTGRVLVYVWAKEQAKDRGQGVDVFVPWALHQKFSDRTKQQQQQQSTNGTSLTTDASSPDSGVLQRYYHLFVKGELEDLCNSINEESPASLIRCEIVESYYDQENWCVVLRRTQ